MSAAPTSTALLLDRIAATLRVPVETFTATRREPNEAERSPSVHLAALLLDPEGARVAAAFYRLPRGCRAALANTAEALVDHARAPAADRFGEPR
jgi:hypothetical protein